MKKTWLSLVMAGLLGGCQSTQANLPPATQQSVVMISLDGFRWDYIEKHGASNLAAMAQQGVRAEQMRPAYPTKTFPNHLSLITGLYPSHHGIVDNHFCDKGRQQCYALGDGGKDSTWLKGMPLWNLAELNGLKAATYFWPESDAQYGGMTPSYFYHFSQQSDYHDRVSQIIDWLKLPANKRPQFVAGYFSLVDTMGHRFGPDAPQTHEAVQLVDGLIGELRERIQKEVAQPVNLVIVSDHGMTAVDPKAAVDYRQLPISGDFKVVNASTRLMLYAKPGVDAVAIARQKAKLQQDPRFVVRSDAELAERHYVDSPRIADIILELAAPRFFTDKDLKDRHGGGNHGYSYTKDMGALFVAEGPAFKKGVTLAPFDNIDVYPMVAKVLGIPLLAPIDGEITPLLPALK
ncbi:ectonucleotide pyrophosphatase/phosphodiesterase [Gallaecimonas xiamenensis]|uniref:Putative type I phosphodiesterase/nucleotide pyrophosphatase protein n=1 Tax=Gallaecimonas xiamenensis 3-C-1 TaxID=745411 RepID=K2JC24_9GAMM|nr:ectonucleotide pyrophosphatase/phosphodiesterase [Gallaecimonas xiamenensis]EKE72357.1 putative type I phosphodiesterase/nucleotide pyrophosphatase protein [Gallaecimonas xiamenensis 3-C-1]